MKIKYLVAIVLFVSLIGCSASQTQVFQSQLFAWDDQNVKTASDFATQITKHWLFNYKVVEETLEGKLGLSEYYQLKIHMDRIKALSVRVNPLTEEEVAIVNVNFAKFLQKGGEKLLKEGLPQLLKFVAQFKVFFGI